MQTIRFIIELLSAFLVPIIAAITVYIAYRQHITDRQRLKFELYDKRFEVYLSVRALISEIVLKAAIESEKIIEFSKDTREAEFLFDKDILDYIKELIDKSAELCKFSMLQEQVRSHNNLYKLNEDKLELLKWFSFQAEAASIKFGKYLSLRSLN